MICAMLFLPAKTRVSLPISALVVAITSLSAVCCCSASVQSLVTSVQCDRQAYTPREPIALAVTFGNPTREPAHALDLESTGYGLGFLMVCHIWQPQVSTGQSEMLSYSGPAGEPLPGFGHRLSRNLEPATKITSTYEISQYYQFASGTYGVTMGDMMPMGVPDKGFVNPLLLSNTAFFHVFATAEERDKAAKAGLPELAVEIALGERKVVSSQAPANTRKGVFSPLTEACELLEAKPETKDRLITITRADRTLTIDTTTGKFTLRVGRKTTKGETDLVTAGGKLMVCFPWLAESLGVKEAKLSWRVVIRR